ncbi:MAG: hypothetical protein KatS3mg060_2704 [Dehalococcoidia bacterium]|nr:MAG: hypothetical protein KatS3mg060_2704 [Dehalococcoidia bacterium]
MIAPAAISDDRNASVADPRERGLDGRVVILDGVGVGDHPHDDAALFRADESLGDIGQVEVVDGDIELAASAVDEGDEPLVDTAPPLGPVDRDSAAR